MSSLDPVDGFTVEHQAGVVILTLSNRYGQGEQYTLDAADAYRIGMALLDQAHLAMVEQALQQQPPSQDENISPPS
jgi:hypothetical protein